MNLKELRISKGLAQEKASSICDVPLRTYKRLENDISYSNSLKYKDVFNTLSLYSNRRVDKKQKLNILVVGAGYVGFSIAVLLSTYHHVDVVDINEDKVNKINKRIPIFKDKKISDYSKNKKLNLNAYLPSTELYKDKDYIIIAIPTDFNEATKVLKTDDITSLVKGIRTVNKKALIVIKSTCYIGFTDSLNDNNVIYCPEFLREGRALLDNLYPARIVIGGDKNNRKVKAFAKLMQSFTFNRAKVLFMSPKEAEAVKLFSNAYLAMRVAYFNELDSFAMSQNINSKSVVEGVCLDPRIGDFYNNPSFGYGGYCLPKDTDALICQMSSNGINGLVSSIGKSNRDRKEIIAKDILAKLEGKNNPVVGVYSIQSKKDSDNKRHAAILDVIEILQNKGINILYYESETMSLSEFKSKVDLILANRYDSIFHDVKEKIYTRDLFERD